MAETKWTAGPWHCNPEADLHRIGVYAGDGDEIIICDASDEDLERDGEHEANAYLIAAAPALYEALRLVMAEGGPLGKHAYRAVVAAMVAAETGGAP